MHLPRISVFHLRCVPPPLPLPPPVSSAVAENRISTPSTTCFHLSNVKVLRRWIGSGVCLITQQQARHSDGDIDYIMNLAAVITFRLSNKAERRGGGVLMRR
ncbi:hypothetical protein E2C01_086155 [Portunus trituberculatus]|uniref:Uncharacterized protein n=1 Tax=Portunus trituberculatus TaxID=210409 RepID=A0A5B7JDU5_PORTR|nr:hypothetical protein [Portunus trituberculatus]